MTQTRVFTIGLFIVLTSLGACGEAVQGFKQGWNEADVQGTWKVSSIEGADPEQAKVFLSTIDNNSLNLAGDRSYKFVIMNDVSRGRWEWSNGSVVLTETEKNGKPVDSTTMTLSIVGTELIHKDESRSYVFARQ